MLPSVFRPDIDGDLQLDQTVATSAQVTAQNPFTVTYELNLEASWTSNAPIAAEDFVYLWERMRDEPGVVDAAGYRLITDVRSRAAGKAVDVVFSQPYPAWKTLFSEPAPGAPAQGRARLVDRRADQRPARVRRRVPRRLRGPGPRRDPAHPQRPVLGHPRGARPARAAPPRRHRAGGRPRCR